MPSKPPPGGWLTDRVEADRSELLIAIAPGMAAGQIQQARAKLANPHRRGRGNHETNLKQALQHMRTACGWLQHVGGPL